MVANVKITALPLVASLALTDIFPMVDDPGGTPVTSKATFTQLQTLMTGGLGTASQILGMNTGGTQPEWHSYLSDDNANAPSTGLIRASNNATPVPLIVGNTAGVDYSFLNYDSVGATWNIGNSSQYSYLYGYATTLYGISGGCAFYDGRNALTTDSAVVTQYLIANKTTTSSAGAATNFTFAVNAGEIWEVEWFGNLGCSSTGGVKLGLDCPVGTTVEGQVFGCSNAVNAFTSEAMIARNTGYGVFSSVAGPSRRMAQLKALVIVGGTAGNITLRMYSQVNTETSTMYANCHFKARRAVGV